MSRSHIHQEGPIPQKMNMGRQQRWVRVPTSDRDPAAEKNTVGGTEDREGSEHMLVRTWNVRNQEYSRGTLGTASE